MSFEAQVLESQSVLGSLLRVERVIESAAGAILDALKRGGKVLACGNGGSAAQAQHFVTELVGRYRGARPSLPAVCLGGDATSLSCLANDFTWDLALVRALEGLGAQNDILVCFSTSGRSENIVRVLDAAKERRIPSFALLGSGGGKAKGRADWEVLVESMDTARIQEAHLFILHWICERVERAYTLR